MAVAVGIIGLWCCPFVAASAGETHEIDLAAFFNEVDKTYPYFDLKGIRGDWVDAKRRLTERVKTCGSETEFLGIVVEAIRCLRDAHMGLNNTKAAVPELPPQYYPGLSFMPATQGRVVVMWAADALASKLKPGTVIARIDGQAAGAPLCLSSTAGRAAWRNSYA